MPKQSLGAPIERTSDSLRNGYSFEQLPEGIIEISDVTGGMVDRLPRDQLPPASFQVVRNARIRDEWCGRRPGTVVFGGPKPDSNPVMKIISFVTEAGDVYLCRIGTTSFHVQFSAGLWESFSILDVNGDPSSFDGQNRFTFTSFFDDLFLADGVNPIWHVDFGAFTVQQIPGAPRAKYITTFAERIVAGNVALAVGGVRPATIVYSSNSDPFDWTGPSAGFLDLAANDIGDPITGVFGLEDVMVIMQRKSIAHATRQPFAQNPFRITTITADVGSDIPYSIQRAPGGLVFADQRTREIYYYSPGAAPTPLTRGVNRTLFADLAQLSYAEGAYDPYEKEYHLAIAQAEDTQLTRVWIGNIEKQGVWCYDDSPTISTLGVISFPGSTVSIDELIGTIDSQTLAIDEFGGGLGIRPSLLKGTATGELLHQTYDATQDWNGSFVFELQSQNMGSISRRRTLIDLDLTVENSAAGVCTLEESRDQSVWTNTKAITTTTSTKYLRLPRTQLTGNDLYWRLLCSTPGLRLTAWWARVFEKGTQRG